MAISMLHQDCNYLQDLYTFTKKYTEYFCDKCYSTFLNMKFKVPQKKSIRYYKKQIITYTPKQICKTLNCY
jgi:hypothetical protein